MPKVHISYVISPEDIRSETLDVGANSVLSSAVPSVPGGLVEVQIELVSGSVHALAGVTPTATASAGLLASAGEDPVKWFLPSGHRVAFIAAATDSAEFATAPPPATLVATISAGASLSEAVQVNGKLTGIFMPAGWTSAAITFSVSQDGVTWADLYDDGVERSIASANAVAGRFLALSLISWLGVKYLRLRSGSAAVAVPQTAARAPVLVVAG